jgi:predicted Zn-dependent peptidase
VLALEDTSGRMSRLGRSEIGHGEILTLDEVLERVDRVTLEDCARSAARVLQRPRALAVVGPFEDDAFGGSDQAAEAAVAAHHGGSGVGPA